MKLKYNLIAIALLGFSFSSCSDFLEQNPQTDLSENDFYKTADDILSAVTEPTLLYRKVTYTVTGMFSEKFPPTIPATSSPVQ